MKNILLIILFSAFATVTFGQFLTQGKITFERKTNLRQSTQTEDGNAWVKEHVKDIAQFTISDFTLTFNKESSLYKFEKEQEVAGWNPMVWAKVATENTVFSNFKSGRYSAEKKVFDDNFLIEDSLPEYKWKIVDEMRTIAGYPCRKAITKVCDSIVVVAFYCDEIMVNGGPESFNGLPGMILGIAIPRLYTTWFATNVEVLPQDAPTFKPGKKVKKSTIAAINTDVKNGTKDWGDWVDPKKMLWWLTI